MPVPDPRLAQLGAIAQPQKIVPTTVEFVDIAGLVAGASQGEGLGNQFLANIREVDAIVHVLRCFSEGDVTHVEGSVDPVRDAETVETELMLADLDSLEKREVALTKRARGADKEATALLEVVTPILAALRELTQQGFRAGPLPVLQGQPGLCCQSNRIGMAPDPNRNQDTRESQKGRCREDPGFSTEGSHSQLTAPASRGTPLSLVVRTTLR